MRAALFLVLGLIGQSKFDFYTHGPYEPTVPKPEVVLGYGPGEKHTTYRDQERMVQELVKSAPDRVKYIEFGKSVEGRPLRILAISSPANIARLEQIRTQNMALANGTGTVDSNLPAVVWINQCIHGNEPASFESGMWLGYTLLSSRSPEMTKTLENTVVILNPSYNPDGHERFVVWYNSVATGSPEPDAMEHREPSSVAGRTNHYRFDMNRDRIAMSQDETRAEVTEFLRWNPQVYVDQHGQVSSYFFPPVAQAVNANVDRERYNKWTEVFGRATAADFDKNAFTYYIQDIFDLYYPGYLDSWTTLSGSIGMTHETDGPRGLRVRRDDGSMSTLRGGIEKHFTAALAVIDSASKNREALLKSFAAYKKAAVEASGAKDFKYVYVQGPIRDVHRLKEQLARMGIESDFASYENVRNARSIWGDVDQPELNINPETLVISVAQPQGHLAKALLEPGSDFEPEFVKEQMRRREQATSGEEYPGSDPAEFYDLTGWNVLLAHSLKAWWSEFAPVARKADPSEYKFHESGEGVYIIPPPVGLAIAPSDAATLLVAKLLEDGYRVQVALRPMKVQGRSYEAGSYLIMRDRNADKNFETLDKRISKTEADHQRIDSSYPEDGRTGPGSETVQSVKKPKIGIVFGESNAMTQCGALWWLMEREWKLPFTPMRTGALSGDLRDYSCIVYPAGNYGQPSEKVKEWVQSGGCLILLDGPGPMMGEKGLLKFDEVKNAKGKSPGDLPGALFKAELDPRSFLSFGYERDGDKKIRLAVPIAGNTFYKAKAEGGGAVTLSSDAKAKKVLTGWIWPDDTEKNLAGTVWLHDQPYGQGHIIVFMQDPTQRAMWPGLYRLLLNAMILGPS